MFSRLLGIRFKGSLNPPCALLSGVFASMLMPAEEMHTTCSPDAAFSASFFKTNTISLISKFSRVIGQLVSSEPSVHCCRCMYFKSGKNSLDLSLEAGEDCSEGGGRLRCVGALCVGNRRSRGSGPEVPPAEEDVEDELAVVGRRKEFTNLRKGFVDRLLGPLCEDGPA